VFDWTRRRGIFVDDGENMFATRLIQVGDSGRRHY